MFRSNAFYRQNSPMSEDEMRRHAPSIFAAEPHDSRSGRYTYIPTIDILRGLTREGFQPFEAMQTRVRDRTHGEHTKHLIRMRHVNHLNDHNANEIILINSHNGSSSYRMMAGVYRFACANGLICGTTDTEIRVPHKGDILSQVIDGADLIREKFAEITDRREQMQGTQLTAAEQEAFARAALQLRYTDPTKPAPVGESQLLRVRRTEDASSDLWTTYNRVQESLVRGGQRGRNASGKSTTTRAVTGIDQNTDLNRALWMLAEEMQKLKA